jgi:hyperosmotically inducible periplasmic protein
MRALQWLSAAAVLTCIPLCVPVAAVAGQKSYVPLTDAQIKAQVEHRISELDLGMAHISVAVKDGVVTLSGTVPSLWIKQEAINRARKTEDIRSVVSDLLVMKPESDDALVREVAAKVRQYVFYTIYDDIEVSARDGVIALTGTVSEPYKAAEIADLAARVHGVREVDNKIQAPPTSIIDEDLRFTIASRIYRDPLFWNYAIQPDPPIHVIVDNGHVTLTGVVHSEVERRTAEAIARATWGFFTVENKLRLASEVPSRAQLN